MDLSFFAPLFNRIPADSIAIIIIAFIIWRIVRVNKQEELEETKFSVNRLTLLGIVVVIARLIMYFGDKFIH